MALVKIFFFVFSMESTTKKNKIQNEKQKEKNKNGKNSSRKVNENDVLLREIKALGGDKTDLDLIMNEEDGQLDIDEAELRGELKGFMSNLGITGKFSIDIDEESVLSEADDHASIENLPSKEKVESNLELPKTLVNNLANSDIPHE
jgi:hypothetical protein